MIVGVPPAFAGADDALTPTYETGRLTDHAFPIGPGRFTDHAFEFISCPPFQGGVAATRPGWLRRAMHAPISRGLIILHGFETTADSLLIYLIYKQNPLDGLRARQLGCALCTEEA